MENRIGQQLGSYRLTRLIGQGGFADVYLGEHIHLNTQAAIKVLQMRLVGGNIEQFRHEAQIIASLVHPHIVRILDFGMKDDVPFLVMDYAPNGTLRQRHPKGTYLPPSKIASYVKQVAAALQYAHDRKLIHRDIKPENMLLDLHDEVLLSDFGVALMAQNTASQITNEVAGTAPYMSPEQIQGKPRLASDQYSLGVVVYEWLSGDRPFQGTLLELAMQHLTTAPAPLRGRIPGVSSELEEVVFTALAKEPQQRFANILAFATAFEQASQAAQASPSVVSDYTLPSQSTLPTLVRTPQNQSPQPLSAFTSFPTVSPISDGSQALAGDLPSPTPREDRATSAPVQTAKSLAPQRQINSPIPLVLPTPTPRKRHLRALALFTILAVLLLIGSIGATSIRAVVTSKFAVNERPHSSPATAKTANTPGSSTTSVTVTATVHVTPTVAPTAKPTTISIVQPTATPTAAQPTVAPTAKPTTAASSNPYSPFTGKLVLYDPLSNNSRGYGWEEIPLNANGESCQFTGGTYHAIAQTSYRPCHAASPSSNFTFEVHMQIIRGNCGGLSLRDTTNVAHAYYFQVCQDGSYGFYRFDSFSSIQTLASGSSTAIVKGLGQFNVIAAVANGSNFILYVNHQQVVSINDSTYSQGQFGVSADGNVEAAYSNANLWMM